MANLDTPNKRSSSISKLGVITIYPVPSGSDADTAPERAQCIGIYAMGGGGAPPVSSVKAWFERFPWLMENMKYQDEPAWQ